MATNRYTNLTPATFNPLSVEEIMMVPLSRQKMHDEAVMAAEEMGVFDVNRLHVDDQVVQQGIDDFQKQLTGIQDKMFNQGVDRSLTRDLIGLKRKREQFLSNDGIGGRAQNAFNAYRENVKNILANKNMTAQDQQEAIMYARRVYEDAGGVANNAVYNPYQGFDSVDLNAKMIEYGKNLEPIITKTSGWYKDPNDPTMWRNGERKTTKLPYEVIQNALAMAATGDNTIMEYLREKRRINPQYDARQSLMNSINGVAPLFIRNDNEFDSDIKFDTRKLGNDTNPTGPYSFDTYAEKIPSLKDMYNLTKIENIDKETNNINTDNIMVTGLASASGKAYLDMKKYDVPKPSEKAQENLMEIGKWLVGKNFTFSNPEHKQKVIEYVKEWGPYAGNQNVSVIDPTTMNIGDIAEGITTDRTRFEKSVNRQFTAPGTKFIANGKFYNNRKQMLDDFGLDAEKTLDVHDAMGIVDWDNNLYMNLPKGAESWTSDFVDPIAATIMINGNAMPIYMSRKDGDLGGERYIRKAKIDLNQGVSKMRNIPGKPVEMELLSENDTPAKVQMKWVPTRNGGGVFAYNDGMNVEYMTKEELQANKYALEKMKAGK